MLYAALLVQDFLRVVLFLGVAAMAPKKSHREKRNAEGALAEEHEERTLPDVLVKQLKNVCVCTVCGPGDRFIGRSHSSRSGHPWRPLAPEERA